VAEAEAEPVAGAADEADVEAEAKTEEGAK